jgi:hypothetical protein
LNIKPKFMLINWSRGAVVGTSDDEAECRKQLGKATASSGDSFRDTYVITEVKVLSQYERVEH